MVETVISIIRQALSALFEPGAVVELRALSRGESRNQAGFFDDMDKLAEVAAKLDQTQQYAGIFITHNVLKPEMLAKGCNKMIQLTRGNLTSDVDISRYRWLYVDLDLKKEFKPAGISSTDQERGWSVDKALSLRDKLRAKGWAEPILADSGNGTHLLYPIDLEANDKNEDIISDVLNALNIMVGDERVEVDVKTYNRARIGKLYGTMVRKGDEIPGRLWRRSALLEIPERGLVTAEQLGLLSEGWQMLKAQGAPSGGAGESSKDFERWLAGHGLRWTGTKTAQKGGTIYLLEECPGCHNTDHCAWATTFPNGGHDAGCHHNSCSIKSWKDLRGLLEPDYAAKKERDSRFQNAVYQSVPSAEGEADDYLLETPITLSDIAVPVGTPKEGEEQQYKISWTNAMNAFLDRAYLAWKKGDHKLWRFNGRVYTNDGELMIKNILYLAGGDIVEQKHCKEVIARVGDVLQRHPVDFDPNPHILGLLNGKINIFTGEFSGYTPDDHITNIIPVEYNPNARCKEFIKYLQSITDDRSDWITLIDWFLVCAVRKPLPYILLLTGLGRNGKGIYEKLLRKFFGDDSCREMKVSELEKNSFAKGYLEGKRICFAEEEEGGFGQVTLGTSFFKMVSGGTGRIDTDVKNQDRRQFEAFIQFVLDTNVFPKIPDQSIGWIERFIHVSLPFTFVGKDDLDPDNPLLRIRDDHLFERLSTPEELSGILNLILLRANMVGCECRIWKKSGKEMNARYDNQSNSFSAFAENFLDMIEGNFEVHYPTSYIFEMFQKYCQRTSSKEMPLDKFGFYIKKYIAKSDPIRRNIGNWGRKMGYRGLIFDEERCKDFIKSVDNRYRKPLSKDEDGFLLLNDTPLTDQRHPNDTPISHDNHDAAHDMTDLTYIMSHIMGHVRGTRPRHESNSNSVFGCFVADEKNQYRATMLNMVSPVPTAIDSMPADADCSTKKRPALGCLKNDIGSTDSDSTKANASEGSESDSISALSAKAAKRSADHEEKFKTPDKKVVVRFTEDVEHEGTKYKKDQVVSDFSRAAAKLLSCQIVTPEVKCAACGKAIGKDVKPGIGNLCLDCQKNFDPRGFGRQDKAREGQICEKCGKTMRRGDVIIDHIYCSECYYNNLGTTAVNAKDAISKAELLQLNRG
jgi:phage/plasmid-associated DNA primase